MADARPNSSCSVWETLEPRSLLSLAPLGPATPVPAGGGMRAYDVAVADDGSYLIAAVDSTETGSSATAVRYSAAGQQLGEPLTLAADVAPYQISASMDADGDAVVAYVGAGAGGIYFSLISRDGVVSDPVAVSLATGPNHALFSPAVSMDAAGGFFLAWASEIDSPSGSSTPVRVQAFDAAGNPRAEAFTVVGGEFSISTFRSDVHVAAHPDGSGAVFTYQASGEVSGGVGYGRVSESALIGDVRSISRGPFAEIYGADVAAHADGSSVIGFEQWETGGRQRGFVQRYDATGEPQGEPIDLGAALAGDGVDPQRVLTHSVHVDTLPDGGFVTAFVHRGAEQDTIYAQRYLATGLAADDTGPLAVGSAQSSDPNLAFAANPVIAASTNGTAVVAHVADMEATLHYRRLAIEDVLLEGSILRVLGTDQADAITVSVDGPDVVVTRGAATERFPTADVDALLIDGFGGNDTMTNDTNLVATLRGGDGDDTLFGGGGTDRLHGGAGRDSLWGRDGADRLYGEDGVDSLYGNGSNDRLEGGAQSDHVRGNGGRDMMFGNGGHDRLYGGPGGDRIYGQAGSDQLLGEGGNDRLYGDDGYSDTLHGGAGDDAFVTLDGVADEIFGDGGDDTAVADDDDVLQSITSRR